MLRTCIWLLGALLLVPACVGDRSDAADKVMQTEAAAMPATDAGIGDAKAAPAATDLGGFHLDTGGADIWKPRRDKRNPSRTLRLTLRSSPPGAMAQVDGVPVGVTPTYWEGAATGKPRNFVFTLRGYSMARYRFVPVTDGVVHGKLDKLTSLPVDAGAAADIPAPQP
jgi:hypothetical protein